MQSPHCSISHDLREFFSLFWAWNCNGAIVPIRPPDSDQMLQLGLNEEGEQPVLYYAVKSDDNW